LKELFRYAHPDITIPPATGLINVAAIEVVIQIVVSSSRLLK
jgi:hypothetical protein